jgi:hypothetical protein
LTHVNAFEPIGPKIKNSTAEITTRHQILDLTMGTDIARLSAFEASARSWALVVGICIAIFGVIIIIVAGIHWSTHLRVNWRLSVHPFDEYKIRVRWPWRREPLPVCVAVR